MRSPPTWTDMPRSSCLVASSASLPGRTGSSGHPGFRELQALLRKAVRAGVPTLGVSAGGRIARRGAQRDGRAGRRRAGDRPATGRQADAADRDPLFAPLPILYDVVQWHYDEITELPLESILLATSTNYVNQAFRVGRVRLGGAVPPGGRHRHDRKLGRYRRRSNWPSWRPARRRWSRPWTRCPTTCSRCGSRWPQGSPRWPLAKGQPERAPAVGRELPLLGPLIRDELILR